MAPTGDAAPRRSLEAVMFADIMGYTALMQEDEARAKSARDRMRQVVAGGVSDHDGAVVQYYGDGILATFSSALEAVRAAIWMQVELRKAPQVSVRIGLHAGDIVKDAEGAYGDGVNVASRVEALSVSGGVLMSAKIRDEIRNHGQIETEDMGLFNLKNVEEPVRLYAVSSDDLSVPIPAEMPFRVDPAEFNLPSEAVVGQWSAKVFMDAATPILIENLEGVVLDANPEAERRYGFTRHELIGKPIKMLVPPEQHAQADDLLHRCRAGEEVRNVEGLRWTKSEEVLSVLLTLSALRDELGETVAIATIAVDITALKAAQEALRVERETLDVRVSERTHDLTEARARLQAVTDHLREHVSPEVYKSIVEHPGDQATEPRRKWLTVFFSDIADFATISGEMDADELGAILNEYFQEMTHIISKHGGTVDRYLGDTIFLIFGDPTSQGEQQDALACVSAALEMQDRMSALREEWSGRGLQHPFRPRMGVSSGQCTLGMFGSDLQRSYSILGRHVSLAKKLQRNAAPDQILVSKSTWSLVNDRVTCEPSAPVQANGFAEPVEVFRVVEETEPNAASGTLHRSGPGFSLWLDPEASSAEDRVATVRDLRQALARLEELGDEDPLG